MGRRWRRALGRIVSADPAHPMVLAVGDVERPVGIGHNAVGSGQTRQPPPRYTHRVVTSDYSWVVPKESPDVTWCYSHSTDLPPENWSKSNVSLGQEERGGEMPRKKHSPEQIITKLREAEVAMSTGSKVSDVCRQIGVTEQTF